MKRQYEKPYLAPLTIRSEGPVLSESQEFTITVTNDEIEIEPFTENTFPDISF